jgi:myo-inositol-1-phosphate synthase
MELIKVAIVGIGNCASSLVQGFGYYKQESNSDSGIPGIMEKNIGGYYATDIEVVAAYDIDYRKIFKPLSEAIFENPNCTLQFIDQDTLKEELLNNPIVQPAPIMDGVSKHMYDYPHDESFRDYRWAYERGLIDSDQLAHIERSISKTEIIKYLKEKKVDIIINYLPVGSQIATEFWADICLQTGISFLNCIPVFIGSDPEWAQKFVDKRIAMIGDDMRSALGASIVSAVLQELFQARGCDVLMHYQDNIGGNTDFSNMQNPDRLKSKKQSKENVIKNQILLAGNEVKPNSVKAGPAAYFPALKDNKRAHWLIKAKAWGGAPIEFTADLSVEDSPNSAGVVCDAIRLLKVARELKLIGPLIGPSAWTQKTPPYDLPTDTARKECLVLAKRGIPGYYREVLDIDHTDGEVSRYYAFDVHELNDGIKN